MGLQRLRVNIELESQLKHSTRHPTGNPTQNPNSANRYLFPLFCCTLKRSACGTFRGSCLKALFLVSFLSSQSVSKYVVENPLFAKRAFLSLLKNFFFVRSCFLRKLWLQNKKHYLQ